MSDNQEKRQPGRPKTGRRWTREVHLYEDEAGYQRLRRLAAKWGEGISSTLRRAVREAAKKEGVE